MRIWPVMAFIDKFKMNLPLKAITVDCAFGVSLDVGFIQSENKIKLITRWFAIFLTSFLQKEEITRISKSGTN